MKKIRTWKNLNSSLPFRQTAFEFFLALDKSWFTFTLIKLADDLLRPLPID